jgi:hypothetical protein
MEHMLAMREYEFVSLLLPVFNSSKASAKPEAVYVEVSVRVDFTISSSSLQ